MRKGVVALLGIAGAVGALAAREAWQRRVDEQRFEAGRDYWRQSLPSSDVRWADDHGRVYRIPSSGCGLHLDVYAQDHAAAPVVVLAHGLLSYGRLFVPLARRFFARGYTVVCPDLCGTGFSGGIRGDYPVRQATANIVDATLWARQRFDGPLFLTGISLGGALAYYAAAAGAPVTALSCIDLFTFDDLAALRQLLPDPRLGSVFPALHALAGPFGWVRLPVSWVRRMDHTVAPDQHEQLLPWLYDPLPPRSLTLRTLASAAATPPSVPLEHNTIPTLVINQGADTVLDPQVIRAAYTRLGGPKHYLELPGTAHWSLDPAFYDRLVEESAAWFQTHAPPSLQPVILNGIAPAEA